MDRTCAKYTVNILRQRLSPPHLTSPQFRVFGAAEANMHEDVAVFLHQMVGIETHACHCLAPSPPVPGTLQVVSLLLSQTLFDCTEITY